MKNLQKGILLTKSGMDTLIMMVEYYLRYIELHSLHCLITMLRSYKKSANEWTGYNVLVGMSACSPIGTCYNLYDLCEASSSFTQC